MKRSFKYKYLYILSPVLLAASCNKQLEKLPDNRAVITNVDQVTQLLASAYPHAMYATFTEPISDN
ncbi:MAG: RagB/SusD family nutrient uptake outer membrane protein, partial [Bacteroidetes bacterium]|nr:RagB/SusD family nutrient uptake outer membrane protein [Bacteroidota bacterium]